MWEPILVAIIILFLIIIVSFHTNRKTTRGPPLPPGPTPWPIIGSVPEMWRNRPAYRWVHRVMDDLGTDIAYFRLGKCHVLAVKSPELAREFLKTHDAVFASRPDTMATRMLSRGYLTTGVVPRGDQWKKMRRVMISHVFTASNIRWLLCFRNRVADDLVRFIYTQCSSDDHANSKGKVVDVRTAAQHYSANVMRRMVFGKSRFGKECDNGGPNFEEKEHVAAVLNLLQHVYAFSLSDYFPFLKCLDLDGHNKKVRESMEVIKKYQDPIVNDRIREWRNGMKTDPEDLLDIFICLKDSKGNPLLSDEEVRAQLTELFVAVVDNPYSAAEWALSEMLNQPQIMDKAMEELDRVVGKKRLVQESDLSNLLYLTACAREAVRLHPVAPFNLPHVSNADCTVAGYFIPKGSSVLLSRLGLGRNPKVWEDPMRFDPDRHLSEGRVDLAEDELRFISFTTGRRGCIGVGLGSKVTMMLLARILQGFTWAIPDYLDKIDLTEAPSLFKAEPLYALAKPRLDASLYLSL